jgi:hypothetical protein
MGLTRIVRGRADGPYRGKEGAMRARASADRRAARVAVVVALLLLAAVLLPAHLDRVVRPTSTEAATVGRWHLPLWPLVSTTVALALLVVLQAVRRARHRSKEPQPLPLKPPHLHPVVTLLVALFVAFGPWALLLPRIWHPVTTAGPTGHVASPPPPPPTGGPAAHTPAHGLPMGVLVLLAVVALLIAATAVWARARSRDDEGAPAAEPSDAEEVAALRRARHAIALGDSGREQIINAFVALETILGDDGIARPAHETPDELLARVSARHPSLARDAALLTDTFQLARFSTRPVTAKDVEVARTSLSGLEHGLRGAS